MALKIVIIFIKKESKIWVAFSDDNGVKQKVTMMVITLAAPGPRRPCWWCCQAVYQCQRLTYRELSPCCPLSAPCFPTPCSPCMMLTSTGMIRVSSRHGSLGIRSSHSHYYWLSYYLCDVLCFTYYWPTGPLLIKHGYRLYNVCNNLSACCEDQMNINECSSGRTETVIYQVTL